MECSPYRKPSWRGTPRDRDLIFKLQWDPGNRPRASVSDFSARPPLGATSAQSTQRSNVQLTHTWIFYILKSSLCGISIDFILLCWYDELILSSVLHLYLNHYHQRNKPSTWGSTPESMFEFESRSLFTWSFLRLLSACSPVWPQVH